MLSPHRCEQCSGDSNNSYKTPNFHIRDKLTLKNHMCKTYVIWKLSSCNCSVNGRK